MPPYITPEKIDWWFTYHPPNEGNIRDYELIREEARRFAMTLEQYVPDCADRTTAIRCLREAVMWANAAIACEGR